MTPFCVARHSCSTKTRTVLRHCVYFSYEVVPTVRGSSQNRVNVSPRTPPMFQASLSCQNASSLLFREVVRARALSEVPNFANYIRAQIRALDWKAH